MKYITYQDYTKYMQINSCLMDESEEYKYEIPEDIKERNYNEKEVKEIDKKHDKMFRKILSKKEEMASFINNFLKIKEKIEPENLIQCHTDFITNKYQEKHSDIIYKIKDKPIYFLVEHQSTVNKKMLERMCEYITQIMLKGTIEERYPIVVPVVIYTGFQKWNAKTSLGQKQYNSKIYNGYKIGLAYNLIAIQNYDFDTLLEKRSLFTSIVIIEKCKTEEEVEKQVNKVIENIKEEDKKEFTQIIKYIVAPLIGQEKAKIILEKIKEKEAIGMSPLTKMILDLKIEAREEGRTEGGKEGQRKGRIEAMLEIAQKMLERNMNIKDIQEITGIGKKQLENMQKSM